MTPRRPLRAGGLPVREAPANRRSDVKPAVRIERLERARNPERGVRYVVSSAPDGEPDDDPGLPPMTEEEWEAKHVTAWAD